MEIQNNTADLIKMSEFLPEGKDYEACDDENSSEHCEDEVAGFPPTCIVEHFG